MRIPFLDLSYQTQAVLPRFLSALQELAERNDFIGGEKVADFEHKFAAYCGTRQCVAVNSGTDGLHLALVAAGLEDGDEVVTTPFTFIATTEAISQAAQFVFADVELDTFNLSPVQVAEQLSERSKAILPVHIFGLPSNVPALDTLPREKGLVLIEDACQAHGAEIAGRKVGSFGTAAAFSFYPTKNLSTFGDAGAVTCHSNQVADRIRLLRNHGQVAPYEHGSEGYNSRMDALHALLLALKLPLLDQWNRRRQRLAQLYQEALSEVDEIRFQATPHGYVHVYHLMAVLAERRTELQEFLKSEGIETRVIYPKPLHLSPAYRYLGIRQGAFPNAESIADRVLCLPLYPGMEESEILAVADAVRNFYGVRCG